MDQREFEVECLRKEAAILAAWDIALLDNATWERKNRDRLTREAECGLSRAVFDKGLALADQFEAEATEAGLARDYRNSMYNVVCEWRDGSLICLELRAITRTVYPHSFDAEFSLALSINYKTTTYMPNPKGFHRALRRINTYRQEIKDRELKTNLEQRNFEKVKDKAAEFMGFYHPALQMAKTDEYPDKGQWKVEMLYSRELKRYIQGRYRLLIKAETFWVSMEVSPDLFVYSLTKVQNNSFTLEEAIKKAFD